MSILDTIGNTIGEIVSPAINSQISAAESEAQTLAQAVAVWGVIVAVELGFVIYLLARRRVGFLYRGPVSESVRESTGESMAGGFVRWRADWTCGVAD